MGNDLAVFVTWGAFLVDGNPLTNLMSIGEKSSATGTDPPAPAIVGGLNTHAVFEGDVLSFGMDSLYSCVEFQVMLAQPEAIFILVIISHSTKHFSIRRVSISFYHIQYAVLMANTIACHNVQKTREWNL